MELRDLRAFLTAVEEGQITLAAAQLHVVQSAVSQAVRRLEREFDLQLLERRPDGVRPTQAGVALARHGQVIANAVTRAEEEMAAMHGLDAGTIRIGLLPTALPLLLPQLLMRVGADHPGLRLQIEEGPAAELVDRLQLGHLDIAVVFLPVEAEDLRVDELASVRLAVVHGPGHPLGTGPRVDLAELRGERWVSFAEGNPGRRWLERAAALAGFQPRVVVETDTLTHLKALVEADMGIAMLPAAAAEPERQAGRLKLTEIDAPAPAVTVACVCAGSPFTAVVETLGPLLAASVDDHAGGA